MKNDIWIKRSFLSEVHAPVALIGSPGLRSIGKLAVNSLISQSKAKLIAELYSTHMPAIHQTTPSYAAHPSLPGMGGVIIENRSLDLPKIQFYVCPDPSLIIAKGYHANFEGQYLIAEKVVDFLSETGVKRMLIIAGYGSKEKKICCAATSQEVLDQMKKNFDIGIGYKGPFMGFSGLVFGSAKVKGIEAIALFVGTEPKEDDLELPDIEASNRVVNLLGKILNFKPE